MSADRKLLHWIPDILSFAVAPILGYFLFREILKRSDPEAGAKQEAAQKANVVSQRLSSIFSKRIEDETYDNDLAAMEKDVKRMEEMVSTPYEQTIAMEVVAPDEIAISFEDIGGSDDIIEESRESVIYPSTMPHSYSGTSSSSSAPSGVSLYGPPGCGKTMSAKASAHESGACFINLHISTSTEKWYGDSNKLVNAVFSSARKLQPSIVFIDEIDAVLGQRRSGEHEASGMVKAEFMTHWDGLTSTNSTGTPQRICILGATNRIQDIDEAILRRSPKKFPVSLPSSSQRRSIFQLTSRDTKLDPSSEKFDLDTLVRVSAGMSGSDIKEACRDAAMVPVREFIREAKRSGKGIKGVRAEDVRGLQTDDFFGRRGGVPQLRNQPEVDEWVDEDEGEERGSPQTVSESASASPAEYEDVREEVAK